MAASEASILNALGMTAEEYLEKNSEEMDLSEKHLAWFTATALPEAEAYPEGAYPYNVGQAGEGVYPAPGSDVSTYDYGGNYFFAASSLASGIGVVKESLVPYGDSEGRRNSEGDWSLPEEQRYMQSFEYVVDEDNRQMDHLSLLDYDHMPAAIISSTLFEQPVYAANIFEAEEDSVLQYVLAMTG